MRCKHNFIQARGLHGYFRTSEQSRQPHAAPSWGGRGGGAGQRGGELIWKKLRPRWISSKSWVRRNQTMVVTLIKLWESNCKISNPGSILHCIQIRILRQYLSWKMQKDNRRKYILNQYFRSRLNVWPAHRTSQSSAESSSSTLKAALMVNSFHNGILCWLMNTMMILLSKCLLFPTD